MDNYEERLLLNSLKSRKLEYEFDRMNSWCKRHLVYRLPASGWVVGMSEDVSSLNFNELYHMFISDESIE